MSEQVPTSRSEGKGRARQAGAILAPIVLLGLLAWLIWPDGEGAPSTERFVTEIEMLQPPPPPEPEPEEPIMEEEEEIVEPSEEPPSETPSEEPVDQPQDAPEPSTASNQLAGLDRPADAGSDNFRLAAGGGGGLFGRGTGGGRGGGEWGAYVEGHIRRALMRDPRTRAAKGSVDVTVVISDAGRFTRAALRTTTGDQELDAAIRDVLSNLPPLNVRRPAEQAATTYATIDMRRS
ncbi:energy transducer TonB [Pelagerythrobacter rhizovicinus]|uniref:Energy transducer TonB n=1 Tax=Pelagerythrobacter rhizovicinus TaxID=2268576 RepID=A0A4Q2KLW6_9SPHN|nr:energy transducer TonB [Pelagerythrobacter rhizovicinus]RXZ66315.1 energy transducer TonB [Pelagerythrobacter rhizovicinus]